MTWQTVVVHVTIAITAIVAVCILASHGTIPGSDAFAVIMAVLVGAGVIAGVSSQSTPTLTSTTTTPTTIATVTTNPSNTAPPTA